MGDGTQAPLPRLCGRTVRPGLEFSALSPVQSRLPPGHAVRLRRHDGQDPDIRFDKHKAGIKANSFVRDHGLRLLPQLYERFNPMPYEDARAMEVELGIGLRRAGYGVWQA